MPPDSAAPPQTPSLSIQFLRPRDEVEGPTLGPFPWVQLTYTELRAGPDGDPIALFDQASGDWYLGRQETPLPDSPWNAISPDTSGEPYSDVVIFPAPVSR